MRLLNVVSPDAFGGLVHCANAQRAGSLPQLREALEQFPPDAGPASLDLHGHSTRDHHLLRLGDTPIDMLNPHVARFFRDVARSGVLDRLGVVGVRLLGCETAVTDSGRRTLRMLARTLGRPVSGTTVPLLKSHSNANGFNPAYAHLLVEAAGTLRERVSAR
jgi:hypothetical protein